MSDQPSTNDTPGIAWPDMFVNLQTAYGELTQAQVELERRATELAQARDLFDQTLETLTEGLFVADQTGQVTRVNSKAAELLQRPDAEIVGRPLTALWTDPTVPTTPWRILEQSPNGRFGPIEAALLTAQETSVPVSLSCAVMRDMEGRIIGVLAVARDIREMRLLQQQLIQSGKLAAVGELATGVAHELNQPLQIIRGYAQTVQDFYQVGDLIDEGLIEDLHKIVEGTGRMMRIIDHLRTFARQANGERGVMQINTIVENALLFVAQQLRNQHIEVVTAFQDSLPNIRVDPHQIEQVLLNLLANARDAMPGGGQVIVSTEGRGQQVLIQVRDSGGGIPEDVRDRIFEPFFTTKDVGKGTGLGLSISYNIVRQHGGEILVASELGQGATFTIALPTVSDNLEEQW